LRDALAAKAARWTVRGRASRENGGNEDVHCINLAGIEDRAENGSAPFNEEVGDAAAAELHEQGYDRDRSATRECEDLAATCTKGRPPLSLGALGDGDPEGDTAGALDEAALQG
jgi:hypothetical protein